MIIQNSNIKLYKSIKDLLNHKFWEKLFFIFSNINLDLFIQIILIANTLSSV